MWQTRGVKRLTFFVIIFLSLIPLLLFLVRSQFAHELYQFPQVINGSLDLSGYDLSTKRAIPLDGKWEFYYGQWIVSERKDPGEPDLMAPVPQPWSRYEGLVLSGDPIASYRITLKNCPDGQRILCYIPNICASYRVYLNEILVASRGFTPSPDLTTVPTGHSLFRHGIPVPVGSEAELVIELLSPQAGGLYMTPILTEQGSSTFFSNQRIIFESVFIGIIMAALLFFTGLQILRNNLLSSSSLLILDLLVFFRILVQNDHLSFLQPLIPMRDYTFSTLLLVITLFLPVVLLFCVRELIRMQVSNQFILRIAVFELCLAPFILVFALSGRLGLSQLLSIVSYFPFYFVIRLLYQGVMRNTPYALLISGTLMLAISSMVAASLSFSGWLTMRIDLFPAASFMLSMALQLWIAMLHSLDIQKQALEAAHLRLQLRESALKLRLSQIKPHFLYNTLLAIHMLCTENPETAAETTLKFATFLRTNMTFIESNELIPFEKELTHIQNYTDIELLRFQRRLNVRFDIQATDFLVPPLSIQPLLGNAIKHGACKNIKGGTVLLSTRETDAGYVVEITDDGPGFDSASVLQSTDSSHGLPNILFRLREQSRAQVEILSARNQGTTIRITLPKEAAI